MAVSQPKHRFFLEPGAVVRGRFQAEGALPHQLARVLRLRPGSTIVVLDGSGQEWLIELHELTAWRATGVVLECRASQGEPRLEIALYQAMLPRDKLEVVLQKGTEVGVSAFIPVWCERSLVPRGEGIDARRLERWRRIVQEAAEQSRRGRVPVVHPPLRFAEAVAEAVAAGPTLLAWEDERERSVRDALGSLPWPDQGHPRPHLSIFIGPEGGFTADEVHAAVHGGVLAVSLGPRILRTETAGPVLAALALYERGELAPPLIPPEDTCPRPSPS